MTLPEERLHNLLKVETEKIKGNTKSIELLYPLIEIIRSVDFNHFMLSHYEDRNSHILLERYRFGWSIAFLEFYHDFKTTDTIPLFIFNKAQREWVDSILQHAGKIGLSKQFLYYCKADLFTLEAKKDIFQFKFKTNSIGGEFFEKKSLFYYHSAIQKILETKSKNVMDQLPRIRKSLEEIVSIREGKYIEYQATPEIDSFYSEFGYIQLMTTQVVDDFGEDDYFGGIPYSKYLDFAQEILKGIIMHRDFCMAAALKSSHKIFLRDILTHSFSKGSFLKRYSDYSGVAEKDLNQILSCFTLMHANLQYHLSFPGAGVPPYILLGPDTIMRSSYGCIDRPIFFLNRELKRQFPKDYFAAVNNREKRFRDQLYSLFPDDRIIKIEKNVYIRSNKIETDIDGVLYDRKRKVLGLFQLKWQDTYSSSMKERFSRMSNLIPKSVEWIDKVDKWLKNNNLPFIAKALSLDETDQIEDIYLFVISRNHVHFSGQHLDERAIWASWFQLIEASAKVKDVTNSNPIAELAVKLNFYSPEQRTIRKEIKTVEGMDFKLSKYWIKVSNKIL